MATQKQERPIPPYLPFRTFLGYVDGLRTSGIPAKIDRSVLRNRSGAEQTMIINAFQYLGLITSDGAPTPALLSLVNAEEGLVRTKALSDLLVMRYMFLFCDGFNLNTATPAMVKQAFAEQGVGGDTIRKSMAFFLAAAQEAQIPISPYLKVRPGRPAGSQRRQRGMHPSNGEAANSRPIVMPVVATSKTPFQTLIDILDPESMDKTEQEAVWTLIRYLKKQETGSGDWKRRGHDPRERVTAPMPG